MSEDGEIIQIIISKSKSFEEVLQDGEVVIDMHFFDEFSQTKSLIYLKRGKHTKAGLR